MAKQKSIPYKLNSIGDFYVEDGCCVVCMAPESVAPNLMGFDPGGNPPRSGHCYSKKQPSSEREVLVAIEAVDVACCDGLRYRGEGPEIIALLTKRNLADQID